jgi:shikimate kinase
MYLPLALKAMMSGGEPSSSAMPFHVPKSQVGAFSDAADSFDGTEAHKANKTMKIINRIDTLQKL